MKSKILLRSIIKENFEQVEDQAFNEIYILAKKYSVENLPSDVRKAFERIKGLSEALVLMAAERRRKM